MTILELPHATALASALFEQTEAFLKTIEEAIPDFASAVSGPFSLPEADVMQFLRVEFVKLRARTHELARQLAAGITDSAYAPAISTENLQNEFMLSVHSFIYAVSTAVLTKDAERDSRADDCRRH